MLHTVWLNIAAGASNILDTVLDIAASKYAIVCYLALLVLIIAVLVIVMLANSSKSGTAKAANVVIQNGSKGAPISVGTSGGTAEKARVETAAEAEENAPRFCMLSRIDENKRIYDARK
ncbi:MAG: hypothetical protein IJC64_04655, partial [Clostridia bacterium]|nr:hypothetical protein [Clostridia bacterium]